MLQRAAFAQATSGRESAGLWQMKGISLPQSYEKLEPRLRIVPFFL
jgi:hypothetical protein